jgi:hypothetical protein
MIKVLTTSLFFLLALCVARIALADSIELADGTLLEGDFVGSSNGIVMFNTGDNIEAFPEDQVVGIFLSGGVATRDEQASRPAPDSLTVPAGTRLVIRTTDNIDSRQHNAGHRFRGQLEGALVVGGTTVVPRGAFIHGRITQASQAGRVAGRSELAIEFTDIMINDQLFPIVTTGIQAQGGNEGGRTAGRTARAAAIGGLIGGRSGLRTGAAVGVGASLLTSGQSINITRGTILEANLSAPLTVQQ